MCVALFTIGRSTLESGEPAAMTAWPHSADGAAMYQISLRCRVEPFFVNEVEWVVEISRGSALPPTCLKTRVPQNASDSRRRGFETLSGESERVPLPSYDD